MIGLFSGFIRTVPTLAAEQTAITPIATSTFDKGDDGWTTTFDARCQPTPCYTATGGNPGGAIYSEDALQGVPFYFIAPPKFLGNVSRAYQQHLTFDMRQSIRDRTPTNYPDIVLVGAGGTQLVFDTPNNPHVVWGNYDVPLTPTTGWHKGTIAGPRPTAAEMQAVLGALTALRIRGDYIYGQATCFMDNVVLGGSAVPVVEEFGVFLPLVAK